MAAISENQPQHDYENRKQGWRYREEKSTQPPLSR